MSKKILIIERNDDIREMLGEYFSEKYTVTLIPNGNGLIKDFLGEYDLLLWDYHQPDTASRELTMEFLRSQKPVIISATAYMEMKLDFQLMLLPRIIKPYNLEELNLVIISALAKNIE